MNSGGPTRRRAVPGGSARFQDAPVDGPFHRLAAAVDAELLVDVFEVVVHGVGLT